MGFDFSFSPDQEAFRAAARAFLEREVAPHVAAMDATETFPRESIARLRADGYFGIPVPEAWGGLGLGKVGYCLFLEELGRVDASHGAIVGAHTSLGTTPLLAFGTDDQKRRWLVPAARGERLLAFSLTEPGSGSDSGALATAAAPDGDGFRLTGTKLYVTNGAEADTVVVFAATDAARGANGGVTAFLVDRGTDGFTVGRQEKKMGLHGTSTAELRFDGARVGPEHVLGGVGRGFIVAMTALDVGRVSLAASMLGAMQAALEQAVGFARARTQFGHPISEFQGVQFPLADIAMHVHALRYLVYHAAAHQDAMGPDPAAWSRLDRHRKTTESAMVKCLASEWGGAAIDAALQVHGGLGYIQGTPIERAYRDARVARIFEGTNEIQRLLIARELFGRP